MPIHHARAVWPRSWQRHADARKPLRRCVRADHPGCRNASAARPPSSRRCRARRGCCRPHRRIARENRRLVRGRTPSRSTTPAGPQRMLRAKSHCSSCSPSSWPKSLSAETITLRNPCAAQTPQRAADQIVGLVAVVDHHTDAERFGHRATLHELPLQIRRRQFAVGFVGGVDRVAERGGERCVERHREMRGMLAFQQLAQEACVSRAPR